MGSVVAIVAVFIERYEERKVEFCWRVVLLLSPYNPIKGGSFVSMP